MQLFPVEVNLGWAIDGKAHAVAHLGSSAWQRDYRCQGGRSGHSLSPAVEQSSHCSFLTGGTSLWSPDVDRVFEPSGHDPYGQAEHGQSPADR